MPVPNKLPVGFTRAVVGFLLIAWGVWWLWATGAVLILLGLTSLAAAGYAQGRSERQRKDNKPLGGRTPYQRP